MAAHPSLAGTGKLRPTTSSKRGRREVGGASRAGTSGAAPGVGGAACEATAATASRHAGGRHARCQSNSHRVWPARRWKAHDAQGHEQKPEGTGTQRPEHEAGPTRQAFICECGRTQGILQNDNEDTLNALLKATAAKVGSMTVQHSPSYSSNGQGSIERLHRTLLGQMRVVKAQVESNYSMTIHKALSTTVDWFFFRAPFPACISACRRLGDPGHQGIFPPTRKNAQCCCGGQLPTCSTPTGPACGS